MRENQDDRLLSFEEFISGISGFTLASRFEIQNENPGITYIERGLPEFVPPQLALRRDVEQPREAHVVIVSAAGAVGKTTLAREIAARVRCPLWDLAARGPLAADSFKGALLEAFGVEHVADVLGEISAGRLPLVVDALDEARLKSNEASYAAFLQDLVEIVEARRGPGTLLFGRTNICEHTWLLFQERGVSARFLVIEPFARPEAMLFIDRRIEGLGRRYAGSEQAFAGAADRIRRHRQPFEGARDLMFRHLEQAIQGPAGAAQAAAAREFLGYAPVLEAVAILLAGERNYSELRSTLEQQLVGVDKDAPLNLLRNVVERILERERVEKVQRNLRPALESIADTSNWSDWDSLYTPDEQCKRVLGQVLGIAPEIPFDGSSSLRAQYELQIATWVPEHPFLRDGHTIANTVFSSYLVARALGTELGDDLFQAVRSRVQEPTYRPSRLLADFYFGSRSDLAADFVPAELIGILYDSLSSAETDTIRVRFTLEGADPQDVDPEDLAETVGELEILLVEGDELSPIADKSFETILSYEDRLRFPRQLRDASLVVPCIVDLGASDADMDLGPSVHVRCRLLDIRAKSIVVKDAPAHAGIKEDADQGVLLEALRCISSVAVPPVVHGKLGIHWPDGAAYPWVDFYRHDLATLDTDPRMSAAYRRFRRIVMTLRSHSKGSLARYRDKVEHARILQGELGQELLARMTRDGLLAIEGKFYHWRPSIAAELVGIDWQALRRGDVSTKLKDYLASFLDAE